MLDLQCDICEKDISIGEGHVSITYNIENFMQKKGTLDLVVDVITSDQIFTMCGKCANKRSASHAEKILETTLRVSDPRLN